MAIHYFEGDVTDNMDAALNDEISYPKWLVILDDGAEVWVYNESDHPPEDGAVVHGTKVFYPFSTQE